MPDPAREPQSVWIEDAQHFTDLVRLSTTEASLLTRTSDVDEFLSDHASTSAVLVGPKGSGKTLLIKLKRLSVQESGVECIPNENIVDRPLLNPPILSKSSFDYLKKRSAWENLWLAAFSVSILMQYRNTLDVNNELKSLQHRYTDNKLLQTILSEDGLNGPFDVIQRLLEVDRSSVYSELESLGPIITAVTKIHRRTAIFVDNIDEYIEKYADFDYFDVESTTYLKIWHNSQLEAWSAIRRLHGVNPHVRVFMTMREEAYHFAEQHDPQFANLKAITYRLVYTHDDITAMIRKNIQLERSSNLAVKTGETEIERFVGSDAKNIRNYGTGKLESTLDYWLRHCIGRPRDAIAIGRKISLIRPGYRTENTVRQAINEAAASRVEGLFNEVMPFIDGFRRDILHTVITKNVLTYQELKTAARHYARLCGVSRKENNTLFHHPFCILYGLGLIGVVLDDYNNIGSRIQFFSRPGQIPFGSINVLPRAELYLVHPALSDFIARRNTAYIGHLNRSNIVGNGLEWRNAEEIAFLIVADIKGYRKSVMESVPESQTFNRYWNSLVASHTRNLDYSQIQSGDSLLLADRSYMRLVKAFLSISRELKRSKYGLSIRAAGHSGLWRLSTTINGYSEPEINEIVGVAARLQAIGQPDVFLATEDFVQSSQRLNPRATREWLTLVDESVVTIPVNDGGLLNIAKSGKEEDEYVKCWYSKIDSIPTNF